MPAPRCLPDHKEAKAVCIVSLFCVKNKTKNKKQMFIFYVSLTLYKLFSGCQAENNGVFSDHCYFCTVSRVHTHCGRRAGRVCVLTKSYNVCYHRLSLFTESSLLFLIWVSLWLEAQRPTRPVGWAVALSEICGFQCDPWLSVGPVADSTA